MAPTRTTADAFTLGSRCGGLERLFEARRIEFGSRHALNDAVVGRRVEHRRTAQNPEVVARRHADDGVFVVLSDLENPVVARETADVERELGRRIRQRRARCTLTQLAVERTEVALVLEIEASIAQRIERDGPRAFRLREARQLRDLVPLAVKAREVDVVGDVERLLRTADEREDEKAEPAKHRETLREQDHARKRTVAVGQYTSPAAPPAFSSASSSAITAVTRGSDGSIALAFR